MHNYASNATVQCTVYTPLPAANPEPGWESIPGLPKKDFKYGLEKSAPFRQYYKDTISLYCLFYDHYALMLHCIADNEDSKYKKMHHIGGNSKIFSF